MEIIGVGYGKQIEIGESYLQECVVNMWDFPPKGAFVYFSRNGTQMILRRYTKISKDTYQAPALLEKEVTQEMKEALRFKGHLA